VSLPLLKSDPEAADFGFERCDMADGAHRNAAKLVSATASFDEFASVLVRGTLLTTLGGCLTACSGCLRHGRGDAHGEQCQLACGCSGGVAACEHRHTRHSC
jgi:hypothetical protein